MWGGVAQTRKKKRTSKSLAHAAREAVRGEVSAGSGQESAARRVGFAKFPTTKGGHRSFKGGRGGKLKSPKNSITPDGRECREQREKFTAFHKNG